MAQFALAQSVSAQPVFSKVFEPDTIRPGSVSTLTFEITNADQPLTELAFSDVLPAGVAIDAFPNAHSGCGGILTAPAGGGTITLTGGSVPGPGSCSISVDVTSHTIGTHMNVTSQFTHSAGTSSGVSDDLTVVPTIRATIRVTKDFTGSGRFDIPFDTTLIMDCDGGLIPGVQKVIDGAAGHTFVITEFTSGSMDCHIFEQGQPGYWADFECSGPDGCGATDDSYFADYWDPGAGRGGDLVPAPTLFEAGYCEFTNIEHDDEWLCAIRNRLLAVRVDVFKWWVDDHPEFNNSTHARGRLECDNLAPATDCWIFQPIPFDQGEADGPDISRSFSLRWWGEHDDDSVLICPSAFRGHTECWAYERVRDSSVESEHDCNFTNPYQN